MEATKSLAMGATRTIVKRATATSVDDTTPSASSLVSTLAPVLLYALIYFAIFLIFRRKFKRYYQPRTFLGSLRPEQRSPKLDDSLFGWIKTFRSTPDTYVLMHHSLDGYLFLRFLKIAIVCCLVGCVITMPVLFPVYATGGAGLTQLNIITFANQSNYWTYWAPAGCAVIFFSFVIYMITRESIFYINLRQAYLMSPLYASRVSSRTVLFTSVPLNYMNEQKLRAVLGHGVRRMWFATDCKELEDLVGQRDKAAMKLEGAETKLITTANKNRLKQEKKGANQQDSEEAAIGGEIGGADAMQYVDAKKRPTSKLGFLGLIGKKVDTIDWSRNELKRLIPQVDESQAKHKVGDAKPLSSVFVEFDGIIDAQNAYASLTHHQALHMSPRYAGVLPGEIIWSNLKIKWWELVIRKIATISFVVALIIFWAIPVAAVGAISNIKTLETTTGFTWLTYIFDPIPTVVQGVITGLLPVILLAVLMALLPIILRLAAKIGGDCTRSQVELTVQNSYFAFQVIQVFLVATIGSAASSAAGQIAKDPASAISLLSEDLPKASNFYLSYFILQGLGVVASMLLAVTGLAIFIILGKLLDKTPRKMYKRWINLSGLGWGTVFPIYTNLFVIAICYAAIAPLVIGFAAIGLSLFYFAFRYNLLFTHNVQIDTKGRVYPRALQQVFVGLYLAELCLVGLFAIGVADSVGAIGPLILMILMVVFTALYQISLNSALAPLIDFLPRTIAAEESRLLAEERGEHAENGVANKEATIDGHAVNGDIVDKQHKKPNMFTKWLRPDVYQDYAELRKLVPKGIDIRYSEDEEREAYFNPAITERMPLLWIPRDPVGMSKKEVADSSRVCPITDDGAYLDDKGKVVWDAQEGRPPIFQETPYY